MSVYLYACPLLPVCLSASYLSESCLYLNLPPACLPVCLSNFCIRLVLVRFMPVFPFAYLALLLSTRLPINFLRVRIFCLHAPLLPDSRLLLCLSANPRPGRLPVWTVAFSFSKLLAYTDAAFVFAKH
jgi:hypothetical protein